MFAPWRNGQAHPKNPLKTPAARSTSNAAAGRAVFSRSWAQPIWSAWAIWTPATGPPTLRPARASAIPSSGSFSPQTSWPSSCKPCQPGWASSPVSTSPRAAGANTRVPSHSCSGPSPRLPLPPVTSPRRSAPLSASTSSLACPCSGAVRSPRWTPSCCWPCSVSVCARSKPSSS